MTRLLKTFGISMAFLSLTLSAQAIPNPIPSASELPEFDEFNTVITVPSYADRTIYRFNPSTTGVMTVYSKSNGRDIDLFVSKNYNQETYTVTNEQYFGNWIEDLPEGYNFGYSYEMTPDVQYYISIPISSWCAATEVFFTWEETEAEPTSVTKILPNPSATSVYDYYSETDIQIYADKPISSFGEVVISYLDEEIVLEKGVYCLINGSVNSQFLQVNVSAIGRTNYAAMAADAGSDTFTITVKDLYAEGVLVTGNETGNDNVTVANGTVSVTFNVAPAPNYVADASTWPSLFYAYWPEGEESGIATLVFSQPLKSAAADVTMGALTPGETGETLFQTYPLSPKVSGNTITIDFTGVSRIADVKTVTVQVYNVKGENGMTGNLGENGTILFHQIPYSPDEATSGILNIETNNVNGNIFNLNGVKVVGDTKELPQGIYIINGKKVIVK